MQRSKALVTGLTLAVLLTLGLTAGAIAAAGHVGFSRGPGKGAPTSALHGLKMLKFSPDNRPVGTTVTSVPGPTGNITFSAPLTHYRVSESTTAWATWSHNYKGDVYYSSSGSLTITLPSKTTAFYFYAEPNVHRFSFVTASSGGTSSGQVKVHGNHGAKYFGFFARGKGAVLTSITVSCSDTKGFAVGEFGISNATGVKPGGHKRHSHHHHHHHH